MFDSFTKANKLRTHNCHPYHCEFCQKWHVGTILRRKNKSKNRKTIRIL